MYFDCEKSGIHEDYVHKSGLGRVIHVLLINAVLFTVVQ